MPNALKGIKYVYVICNLRASDLNEALQDSDVLKAIISCIGGEDAIRILPYVYFQAIYDNPKIFSVTLIQRLSNTLCFIKWVLLVFMDKPY